MPRRHVTRPITARITALIAVVLGVLGLVATQPATAAPSREPLRQACAPAHGRVATCFAQYRHASAGARRAAAGEQQLTPADIASAYRLPSAAAPSSTVAIVDAYDNPNVETDLAAYRARFGLPACTTANGCFRKVNQRGAAAPLPAGDAGWGLEISLDVDAVSAACPSCHILLVEGDTPSLDDLGAAVNTAVRLKAAAVSNSYGASEFNGIDAYTAKYYDHPGVAVVASSGDGGFGVPGFPAVATSVVAVGGTTLTKAATKARGWTERAWDGAGSGCSGYVAKPSWQHDANCPTRTVADVSAVADPESGFVVRDTYGLGADNGYLAVGGTSLSAPLITAMIVRAGGGASFPSAAPVYARPAAFFDVVGGSNGYCGGDYLCTGTRGYDAPTGVGSPNGLAGLGRGSSS